MEQKRGYKQFKTETEYLDWKSNNLVKSIMSKSNLVDGTVSVSYLYWVP